MLTKIGLCPATLLTDLTSTTGDDVRCALDEAQQAGVSSLSVWMPHLQLLELAPWAEVQVRLLVGEHKALSK